MTFRFLSRVTRPSKSIDSSGPHEVSEHCAGARVVMSGPPPVAQPIFKVWSLALSVGPFEVVVPQADARRAIVPIRTISPAILNLRFPNRMQFSPKVMEQERYRCLESANRPSIRQSAWWYSPLEARTRLHVLEHGANMARARISSWTCLPT